MSRPFKRLPDHAWLGGVSSGLAYAFGWPTWVVRLVWIAALLCLGFGPLIYLLLWIVVPRWPSTPSDYRAVTGDA
jgi:phage shock protein PspC (stress-responsive transcriptional regulator)